MTASWSKVPRLRPRAALAAAAVLHLTVTLGVLGVGRSGVVPAHFDRDGLGEFAADSRQYRDEARLLADVLSRGDVPGWLRDTTPLHVRLYSLDLFLTRRLLGSSILAFDPLNLVYYLAILGLTFALGTAVSGERAGWTAAILVAVWPSLLLHTTQLVRDNLLIVAILAFVLIAVRLLTSTYDARRGLVAGLTGTPAGLVIWMGRRDLWLIMAAVVGLAVVLFIVKALRTRRVPPWNAVVAAFLCLLAVAVPYTSRGPRAAPAVTPGTVHAARDTSISARIAHARERFVLEGRRSGSLIDADVDLTSEGILTSVPRALAIGFLAPFPRMWFATGRQVGWPGRMASGAEMSLTYVIEALACVFVWRSRGRSQVWLLFLTIALAMLSFGLVVVNIGTLYRVRYPFWILLVVMAAGAMERRRSDPSRECGPARPARPPSGRPVR